MAYPILTLIYTNMPETDYPEWSSTTSYWLNDIVMVTTNLVHKCYQSLVSGNVGNSVYDTTKWLDIGWTNRWKMFDFTNPSDQTVSDGITTVYDPALDTTLIHVQCQVSGDSIDTLALLNITTDSVQVRVHNDANGLIYDQTKAVSRLGPKPDGYFFTQNQRNPDVLFTGLNAQIGDVIEVKLQATAGLTSTCGALIAGKSYTIGATQFGAKVGITDYSTKSQNIFGDYTITRRPFRKTGEFQIMLPNSKIDEVQMTLAQNRAFPILYIGSDNYTATSILGFYNDFDITIPYPEDSLCTIKVEGLV